MEKPQSVYNILQEAFRTLIFSRIWVALCVLGYTQASFILLDKGGSIRTYSIMLMLGGYMLYVLPFIYFSLKGHSLGKTPRQIWVYKHLLRFYITAIVVACILLIMAFYHPAIFGTLVLHGFAVGLVTVLYELPLIPLRDKKVALREWGFLKPTILTVVWWYLCVLSVAMGWADTSLTPNGLGATKWLVLIIQFIFMLVLCVMFDIRDIKIDAGNNINTWPVKWGIRNTQKALVTLSALGICLGLIAGLPAEYKAVLACCFLILIYLNSGNPADRKWWFYDFVIDGMMLLQCGLLYLVLWLV